jgi:hypothetical protein
MMHIGLMGTHGTGKSTYSRKLWTWAQEEFGVVVSLIKEVARRCPYTINKDTSAEAQLWIFTTQMAEELAAIRRAEVVICDRTVLDGLAYSEAAGFTDVVDACLPMALMWMERYSEVYWFRPVKGRLVDDGFRDTDPKFQAEIDGILAVWIAAYHIPVLEVPSCDAPWQTIQGRRHRRSDS